MSLSSFWDPLVSPWWRSWGILYRATCQVFSTPVAIALTHRFVDPRVQRVAPWVVPMGFTRVKVRSVAASWPRLKVLGGDASAFPNAKVHPVAMTMALPKVCGDSSSGLIQATAVAFPLQRGLQQTTQSIGCDWRTQTPSRSSPLLGAAILNAVPRVVLNTVGKPLAVPVFRLPKSLTLAMPTQGKVQWVRSSLGFAATARANTVRAIRLPVVRGPLPAHRFKVEQRHEFRNQLAQRMAEVPPEKILIRYVVDRVPVTGVARFTPKEDGTLAWTWAEPVPQSKGPKGLQDPTSKAQLAGGGWVVVGQRLDTRAPVMTLVVPENF